MKSRVLARRLRTRPRCRGRRPSRPQPGQSIRTSSSPGVRSQQRSGHRARRRARQRAELRLRHGHLRSHAGLPAQAGDVARRPVRRTLTIVDVRTSGRSDQTCYGPARGWMTRLPNTELDPLTPGETVGVGSLTEFSRPIQIVLAPVGLSGSAHSTSAPATRSSKAARSRPYREGVPVPLREGARRWAFPRCGLVSGAECRFAGRGAGCGEPWPLDRASAAAGSIIVIQPARGR